MTKTTKALPVKTPIATNVALLHSRIDLQPIQLQLPIKQDEQQAAAELHRMVQQQLWMYQEEVQALGGFIPAEQALAAQNLLEQLWRDRWVIMPAQAEAQVTIANGLAVIGGMRNPEIHYSHVAQALDPATCGISLLPEDDQPMLKFAKAHNVLSRPGDGCFAIGVTEQSDEEPQSDTYFDGLSHRSYLAACKRMLEHARTIALTPYQRLSRYARIRGEWTAVDEGDIGWAGSYAWEPGTVHPSLRHCTHARAHAGRFEVKLQGEDTWRTLVQFLDEDVHFGARDCIGRTMDQASRAFMEADGASLLRSARQTQRRLSENRHQNRLR